MSIIGSIISVSKESESRMLVWELMCMGVHEGPSGEDLSEMSLSNLYLLKANKEQQL